MCANATTTPVAVVIGVAATAPPSSLFTAEQWKALAGLFGNTKPHNDRLHGMFTTTEWIVDNGASNHMTSDLS